MKIYISFVHQEKIKSIFNENTDQFCALENKLDPYLIKIQIGLVLKKNQI